MRRLFYAAPLALFVGILGLGGFMLTQDKDQTIPSKMVEKPLPEFDFPAASDGLLGAARKDFVGGKPKLLNFWGSWCAPCIAEAPQLEALKEQGVEIIGLALRDTPEEVERFLTRHGNPYSRVGLAKDYGVLFEFGGSGVPETFVIDPEGIIRVQIIGELRPEHVEPILALLEDLE